MTTFSDDFNRADGGLANGWIVDVTAWTIVSGQANGTVNSRARHPDFVGSGRQEIISTIPVTAAGSLAAGLILKYNPTGYNGYQVYIQPTLTAPAFYIRTITAGVVAGTTTLSGPNVSLGTHTLRAVYEAGIIRLWWDGQYIGERIDSAHDANDSAAIWSSSGTVRIDAITMLGDEAVGFTVSPDPIGNYGSPTTVTFTGVGTSWTPGTPGSPTFTVDHGTLSAQTVTSSTSATATYDPGSFLGTATFYDPSTGSSDAVLVTSNPGTVTPPTGADTWSPYKTLVDNTGIGHLSSRLLTEDSAVPTGDPTPTGSPFFDFLLKWERAQHGPGDPSGSTAGVLNDLVRVLYFSQEVTPGENVFSFSKSAAADALAAHFSLDAMRGVSETTLQDILDAISAGGGGDWDKLFTQLGIDGQATFSSLLVALLALWGPGRPTLDQTYQAVLAAQSLTISTRGELRDFFAALTSSSALRLQSILDVLSAYHDVDVAWHDSDVKLLTDIQDLCDSIFSDIEWLLGPSRLNLDEVLARLDWQADRIVETIELRSGPPIWPGIERVTLGTPTALGTVLTVAGPMDGVIVDIEGTDPGTGFFDYDVTRCWRNIGALAFVTDNGYVEQWQALGFSKGIYTPKMMHTASACKLHLGRGPRGTVRPWTLNLGG